MSWAKNKECRQKGIQLNVATYTTDWLWDNSCMEALCQTANDDDVWTMELFIFAHMRQVIPAFPILSQIFQCSGEICLPACHFDLWCKSVCLFSKLYSAPYSCLCGRGGWFRYSSLALNQRCCSFWSGYTIHYLLLHMKRYGSLVRHCALVWMSMFWHSIELLSDVSVPLVGCVQPFWNFDNWFRLQEWDPQNLTQIVTEMCGFLSILDGTFLLHRTKDLSDGKFFYRFWWDPIGIVCSLWYWCECVSIFCWALMMIEYVACILIVLLHEDCPFA